MIYRQSTAYKKIEIHLSISAYLNVKLEIRATNFIQDSLMFSSKAAPI